MARISKEEYVTRSLAKIASKRSEHYVVNGIIHRLNDPEIEFVCQQYIRRRDGKWALNDLYFPQFNWFLEVNEGHHDTQVEEDKRREFEIIEAICATPINIDVYTKDLDSNNNPIPRSLEELNEEIDSVVEKLKVQKVRMGSNFVAWDFEHRYDPQPVIDRGYICVDQGIAFRNHRDALRCFGYEKGHLQQATWKILGTDKIVWFPKLYENDAWKNSFDEEEEKIVEYYKGEDKKHLNRHKRFDNNLNRVVFAHSTDPLGFTLYRFLGEFEYVRDECEPRTNVFTRVSKKISLKLR